MSHQPDAHYDRVHEAWRLILGEEFHYGYFRPEGIGLADAAAALTAQMLARAEIQPGERVLDIGCGTGHQSCKVGRGARRAGPRHHHERHRRGRRDRPRRLARARRRPLRAARRHRQRPARRQPSTWPGRWSPRTLCASARRCCRSAHACSSPAAGWSSATSSAAARSPSSRSASGATSSPSSGPSTATRTCCRWRSTPRC
ncbi:hypothetical protein G5V59_21715 [Nocardioides sp. W3-2-3]|uniref:SAM-dependent methyltransferase n=1 Tax=Nocardioides convexus TaxID=2712224 RepID=UPI0024181545|nr:class I SAM-dependent methyltransferase [Nocardioides convexus]NHA01533.1 hypothetical protein [Nocardioides convexus]